MNIVAIGGGNKAPIIREIKGDLDRPDTLVIPTACSTLAAHERKAPAAMAFFDEMGLTPTLLHEFGEMPSLTRIQHELGRAGLIYVIGGNTPYLLRTLMAHGTADELRRTVATGTTLAGTSAGALLPFALAHTNPAKKPAEEAWDYRFVGAMGMVPAAATAHADQHDAMPNGMRPDSRYDHFVTHFPDTVHDGFAIDNNAALVIRGLKGFVKRSTSDAEVHHVVRGADGEPLVAAVLEDDLHTTTVVSRLLSE